MIVSAPYRSGGTSLSLRLSEQYNLKFVGQIDSNTVSFTKVEDKNLIHEYQNQPMHTFNDIGTWLLDDSDVVILNNSNPALFSKTHSFIVRKDFTRCYTSMYWMMTKLSQMQHTQVDYMFKKITYFNALLITYLKKNNITPLVLEEQEWYMHTVEHDVPNIITLLAKKHNNFLTGLT